MSRRKFSDLMAVDMTICLITTFIAAGILLVVLPENLTWLILPAGVVVMFLTLIILTTVQSGSCHEG